jgi:hypothetical protein
VQVGAAGPAAVGGGPVGSLLDRRIATSGAGPLVTFYDDASGERVELSGLTVHNWVSKAANLLVDGLCLEPGEPVTVEAEAHWHTAVLVLAAWRVQLEVGLRARAGARALPWAELAADLPGQPDRFVGPPPAPQAPALRLEDGCWSQAEVTAQAVALDLAAGSRLLVTADAWTGPELVTSLVGPLVCSGSLLVSRHTDAATLATRCAAERVTHRP